MHRVAPLSSRTLHSAACRHLLRGCRFTTAHCVAPTVCQRNSACVVIQRTSCPIHPQVATLQYVACAQRVPDHHNAHHIAYTRHTVHTYGAHQAAAAAPMRTPGPQSVPRRTRLHRSNSVSCRCQIGLVYASCTGSTRRAAQLIHQQLTPHCTPPLDLDTIADLSALSGCSGYIVGVPTWNTDASQQRSGTVWDDLLYNGAVAALHLQGKPVAVFGCGDAVRFKSNFADTLAEVHDVLQLHGAQPLGYVEPSTYLMTASKSIRGGHFLGLPLDNHNQPHLTKGRIQAWCQQLEQELQQRGWTSSSSSFPSTSTALEAGTAAPAGLSTQQQEQEQQPVQQQQQPLYISSAPADWPLQRVFSGDYPQGFVFTDRWYQLGDRWYRFADQGFVVTAGFREHTPYTYAYSDVTHIQQVPAAQHLWRPINMEHVDTRSSSSSSDHAEVWLTVRVPGTPASRQDSSSSSSSSRGGCGGSSSSSSSGGGRTKVLVLKQVECWQAGGTSTITRFLQHMCPLASCQVLGAAAAVA